MSSPHVERSAERPASALASALECWDEIRSALTAAPFAVFLDYDGTLAPLAARPDDARMSSRCRDLVRALAACRPVAIVTGRAMPDIRRHVGLDELHYAADHGFEIAGPGTSFEIDPSLRPKLASAAAELTGRLAGLVGDGVVVEAKRYSVAVHYRLARPADEPRIEAAVEAVVAGAPDLRKGVGKKVFEIRPRLEWHKGAAVSWLLEHFGVSGSTYLGDDRTDEDAFEVVAARPLGVGIVVGTPTWPTSARYRLADPDEVECSLAALVAIGAGAAST